MARTRTVVLCLVAIFVVTAFASAASASAASWFVGGAEFKTGTAELAKATTTVENATLGITGVTTITCTGLETEKVVIVGGTNKIEGKLTYTGCTAAAPCTVPASIATTALVGSVTLGTAPATSIAIAPAAGEGKPFANIKFGGESCALTGIQAVTGKLTTTSPDGQTEQTTHELVANSTGELKVGTNAATLKGKVKGKLASGATWSFH